MATAHHTPATPEEASAVAIALEARALVVLFDTVEEGIGTATGEMIERLLVLTRSVGAVHLDASATEDALRRHRQELHRFGAALYRLVEAARDACDGNGPQRTTWLPDATSSLTCELVSAAVRATEARATDRGLALKDASEAWEFAAFSARAMCEMLASALVDRRSALEELELVAMEALTAVVLMDAKAS